MKISTGLSLNKSVIRFPVSVMVSVLLHALALISLQLYALSPENTPQRQAEPLSVRLLHVSPPKPMPEKKLLATAAPSPIKVPQTSTPPRPAPAIETAAPAQGESVSGIALPGAIASPFSGLQVEGNAFFSERHAQMAARRAYQEQIRDSQARQKNEQQAQLIALQLQQFLARQLSVEPVVTGKCKLVEYDEGRSHKLSCGASALYEVLYKDQQTIASMLLALRSLGRVYTGFSADINADKLSITLINEP